MNYEESKENLYKQLQADLATLEKFQRARKDKQKENHAIMIGVSNGTTMEHQLKVNQIVEKEVDDRMATDKAEIEKLHEAYRTKVKELTESQYIESSAHKHDVLERQMREARERNQTKKDGWEI